MKPVISCIYGLSDPSDSHIYYVGQTTDFYRRLSQHLCTDTIYLKVGSRVCDWIIRVRKTGKIICGIVLEENPQDGLDSAEERWIRDMLARREPLLNVAHLWEPQQLRFRFPFLPQERNCFPLRQWRVGRQMSINEAAHTCDVTYHTFERLERGDYEITKHRPQPLTLKEIISISRVTGLPVETLLYPSQHLASVIDPPEKRPRGRPKKPRN